MNTTIRNAYRVCSNYLRKNYPHILVYGGIVGVGVSVGLAIRAAHRTHDDIEDYLTNIDALDLKSDDEEGVECRTRAKELSTDLAKRLVREYFIPAGIFSASVTAIVFGHRTLTKRHIALASAYSVLAKSYSAYRETVKENVGDDEEKNILVGDMEKDENDEYKPRRDVLSPYAKWFDETNVNYVNDPTRNLFFLEQQEKFANFKLRSRGHIFLNEVYDLIGLPHTSAGAVTGWVFDGEGDGYVDFGIYNGQLSANRDFVNGYEKRVLLDFNVDGLIYDLI